MVISSHPQEHLINEARKYGIADYIDLFVGSCMDKASAMSSLCRYAGIAPQKAIFFGDTKSDIRAGRKAGVITIGVLSGYHSEEQLKSENPDYLIAELSEPELRRLEIFTPLPRN